MNFTGRDAVRIHDLRVARGNVQSRASRDAAHLLALVVVLAMAPARAADVLDVETADVTTDAGVVHVDGGCWLSTPRCIGVGRELVALRAENAALKQAPTPTAPGVAVALAIGLILGVGASVAVASLWR